MGHELSDIRKFYTKASILVMYANNKKKQTQQKRYFILVYLFKIKLRNYHGHYYTYMDNEYT